MRETKAQIQNANISKAALHLAAKKGWPKVTLEEVAKHARVSSATIKKHFSAPHEIVSVIIDEITRTTLIKARKTSDSPRDVWFDLLMARFDYMQNNRKAILSIYEAMQCDPALSYVIVRAMLEGFGKMIDAAKLNNTIRPVLVMKLAAIYGWTFLAWIKDNTRDMSKTMAALDKTLRLDEKTMELFKRCP